MTAVKNPFTRFLDFVEINDADCWNWTGACNCYGYSKFYSGERLVVGHRWSYEQFVGPIPDGLTIDHLCRNKRCVNPDHLEAVTLRTNILRSTSFSARNAAKTECVNGHPFDEANTAVRRDGRNHSGRRCRRCDRDNKRRYRKRRAA